MATQQDTPSRDDVIRCEHCGEDYSITYRKCPFCDDVPGRSAPRPAAIGGKKGYGKRQGGATRDALPVEPVRIIGFALGMILIVAAIYIVYSVLSPLFAKKQPAPAPAPQPEVVEPVVTPDPDNEVVTPGPDNEVVTPIVMPTAITLNRQEMTLKANESWDLAPQLTPADSDGTLTWTSSDTTVAIVDDKGVVTNVNAGSGQKKVTITATCGEVTAQCVVYCRPGSTPSTTPTTPSTPSTPSAPSTPTTPTTPGTPVASGTVGTINSDGVRIRKAPVSGEVQDSATKNAEVTVLEQTAEGWYKIRYNGNGGMKEGYIRSDFVDVKSN